MKFAAAAFALVLTAGVGATFASADPSVTASSPAYAPSAAPSPVAVVHISDFAYKMPTVTVHVGDTVEFINDDSTSHTVTAADKSYDSGNMDQGKTWYHTYTKAGNYGYTCAYHAFMLGKVIVSAAP